RGFAAVGRHHAHFIAEKRLSNEFDETMGWAPAISVSFACAAFESAAAGASDTAGFSDGRAAAATAGFGSVAVACLASAGLNALGSGLASATLGFAEADGGAAEAVVSA